MEIYSRIFKNVVFPLVELSQGTHILKTLEFLEGSQWWTPDEIRAFQESRLRELIQH